MHNATGQTFTLRRLAELTGRDIDDLRKAVRKSQKGGLSDDQIIEDILGASNISLSDFVTGEAASSSTLKLQALAEARENAGRTYKNPLAEFVNGAEFGIVANAVRRTAPISIPHKYSCNEEAYDQHYARMSEVEVRRARPLNGWRREYEDVYCHNKKTKIGYDNIAPSDRYVFTDVAIICQLQSIKAAWREVVSQVQNEYGFDLRALFGRRLPGQEEADFYEDLLHQPFYVEPFPGFWGSNLDRWWCYLKTEHKQISTVHKCLIVETRVWRKYTEGQRRREYNSRSY